MSIIPLILFLLTPVAEAKPLDRLHESCIQNSLADGKSQKEVCDCIRANYEKKLGPEALAFLQKAHEGRASKEELLKHGEAVEFDMQVAEECLDDSRWRWTPPKPDPKAKAKPAQKPKVPKKTKN
jgi:hypothetical protein